MAADAAQGSPPVLGTLPFAGRADVNLSDVIHTSGIVITKRAMF
jgi:hypothetical protein